jgi:D-alanyl-D-alanine carboxypeptidase/D-alanyl-D-alanine-endopeptidase (penicillin-binding protein 4)
MHRKLAALATCSCLAITLAGGQAAAGVAADDLPHAARVLVGADQGVQVETEDGTVLVAQAATRAVHPASISKVPTTLALLRTLGPEHRFVTTFLAGGPLRNGTIEGDLIVHSAGDPFLVDENALLIAGALRAQGIERVNGRLRADGPLVFNWASDSSAERLRRALQGGVAAPAWTAVSGSQASSSATPPALRFEAGSVSSAAPTALLTHRSQPLIAMVKALNDYSNNIFRPLADAAGGIASVENLARLSVPQAMRAEIQLDDGAGTSPRNRLSPRATIALLRALRAELARSGRDLADALPVSGIDEGTLSRRLDGPGERGHVVGKTGTFGDYGASALAGAVRTRDRGLIYFAILNRGLPVDAARQRQDAFLRRLLLAFDTVPWAYRQEGAPHFTRAQISSSF